MIPYGDTIPCKHRPILTWLLIFANFVVFLYTWQMPEDTRYSFFMNYGLVPIRYTFPEWVHFYGITSGNYWPFLSSMFLHGGALHVIMNMWMLWIFGDNIEDSMGRWRFLIFYFCCGLAAGVLHILTNQASHMPALGASGAIAGVMGAYFFLYPRARLIIWIPILLLPIFVQVPAIAFIGVWVIIQLYSATTSALFSDSSYTEIAWWGHIGGFIVGATLYRFLLRPRGSESGELL